MHQITIIGHRGAMAYAPENSMSSFETALKMDSHMLEMDLHLSKDGVVVVIHDDKVDRTTNGRGFVNQMTFDDLRTLKLKNGERVLTLAEALERFGGKCAFNLELKGQDVPLPSYEIVSEKGLLSDVLFSSFDGTQLLELKLKDSSARVAFLCEDRKINMLAIARSLKAEAIHPKKKLVTSELIENAHSQGLKVNVWTVNRASNMKRIIKMGADGIITNKPDILAKVLTQ